MIQKVAYFGVDDVSIKLYGNSGVYTRVGSNFDTIGFAWQYRWGEGL